MQLAGRVGRHIRTTAVIKLQVQSWTNKVFDDMKLCQSRKPEERTLEKCPDTKVAIPERGTLSRPTWMDVVWNTDDYAGALRAHMMILEFQYP